MRAGPRMIDDYVHRLDRALYGPGRLKEDLLIEARHSLVDSALAYRSDGLSAGEAERRAIVEFGSVPDLAAGYQTELAANAIRSLAGRMLLAGILSHLTADLMWRDAPWTGAEPPAGYQLVSGSLNWIWTVCGLLAALTLAWQTWAARRGRPGAGRLGRMAAYVLPVSLALGLLGGIVVYGWSVGLWGHAALTWPPMLIGGVVMAGAYAWLGGAARSCLTANRSPATLA